MALAIVLIAIVAATIIFNVMSPWWLTPLASNWSQIDSTLSITLLISGLFFVVINLFLAWAVVRYRRSEKPRVEHKPDDKRLEWWLVVLTAVGITAMLAPGLEVYAKLIDPPTPVTLVEVVAQQWQWSYRFPGQDGLLGASDARFISGDNPFGLNPADPHSRDDVLVNGPELHLPLGQPVLVLLRSKDVLHDFYVPPFRARMNAVPGMVSRVWFLPTKAGRFELLCAQLCGVGHYNMRGTVVVESPENFRAWFAQQPTFGRGAGQPMAAAVTANAAELGRQLAQSKGCVACHSAGGAPGVGPSWKDLYGKMELLEGGRREKVDEAYLREAITKPNSKHVQGFAPIMPKIPLNEREVGELIAYIESLSAQGGKGS
jgi:cytochrome c oxidase subunit 2